MSLAGTKQNASPRMMARSFFARGAEDQSGATSIEYGLLMGLMALVCITAFSNLGGSSGGRWGTTANAVANAMK
jgi:pilus assembly protein Flp/PilA